MFECFICKKRVHTVYDCKCAECARKEILMNYKEDNKLMGWECPRCHKIHGPYVQSCDCPIPFPFYTITAPHTIMPITETHTYYKG